MTPGSPKPADEPSVLDELEAIYDSAPVGLCLVDTEFRFVRINERLATMNGATAADHIGQRVDEIIPFLADQILPRYEKVLATGHPIENVPVFDENADRTWLASDLPVKDRDGRVTGIVSIVRDVTDLTRSRRELHATRERLRRAERVAHLGCWEWDIPNGEVWWSLETYRIFGRDPATFQATFDAFIEQIVSDERQRVRQQLEAVWAGSPDAGTDFRIVRADDGSERMLHGIATLRRDEDGEPLYLFGTVQDVSERQEERAAWAEERAEWERERAELEELLRQRTGALDRALDRLRRSRRR